MVVIVLFLVLRPGAPPEVEEDPEAAQRLEAKLARAGEVASFGGTPSLSLDEPELNAWMRSTLDVRSSEPPAGNGSGAGNESDLTVEQVQSGVRDVKVDLEEDRIHAWVLFDMYGKDISLELEGRLSAQDGYIRLDPTGLWIGSLAIPQGTVERAVERLFGDPARRESFRLPSGVRDIRVQDSRLVVTYE